jgi:hypothetical protein
MPARCQRRRHRPQASARDSKKFKVTGSRFKVQSSDMQLQTLNLELALLK